MRDKRIYEFTDTVYKLRTLTSARSILESGLTRWFRYVKPPETPSRTRIRSVNMHVSRIRHKSNYRFSFLLFFVRPLRRTRAQIFRIFLLLFSSR